MCMRMWGYMYVYVCVRCVYRRKGQRVKCAYMLSVCVCECETCVVCAR